MKQRLYLAAGALALLSLVGLGTGCNSASSSADPGALTNALPGSAAYLADISAGNGNDNASSTGLGGNGANGANGVFLESYGVRGIQTLASGKANATFTLNIPAFTPEFGAGGKTIAANTTISFDFPADSVNQVFFTTLDNTQLMYKNADNTLSVVTGLRVNPGVTVTVQGGNAGTDAASIDLTNDVEVSGTIRSVVGASAQTSLTIRTGGGFFIRTSGVVSTAGAADNAAGTLTIYSLNSTRNGGLILNQGTIDCSGGNSAEASGYDGGYFSLRSDGYLINTGSIKANGGDGAINGGNAPYGGQIIANSYLYNTGTIQAKGGKGTSAQGGNGAGYSNWLDVYSNYASTYNSGVIDISGGNGGTNGGHGGDLLLYNNAAGNTLNSGDIAGNGGNATDNVAAVRGGDGGTIEIDNYGGNLATSGNLSVNGGAAPTAISSVYGGNGGNIQFYSIYGYDNYGGGPGFTVAADWMDISGNLSARGGNGYNGGAGGYLSASYGASDTNSYGPNASNTGGIRFLGYRKFACNGGSGTVGGRGAGITYRTLSDTWGYIQVPAGGIANEAMLESKGGTGSAGNGGNGGSLDLRTDDSTPSLTSAPGFPVANIVNSGSLSTQGGDGTTDGGSGGSIYLWGYDGLASNAAINAFGGANTYDNNFRGGNGGGIDLYATNGDVAFSGTVNANGGNGGALGGNGGHFDIGSLVTTVTGNVAVNGGDAASTLAGANAGSGGYIDLWSYRAPTTVAGTLTVTKGAGGSVGLPATDGYYHVDGVALF